MQMHMSLELDRSWCSCNKKRRQLLHGQFVGIYCSPRRLLAIRIFLSI